MNEQFKGTPGPWKWQESGNTYGYYFLANENETRSVHSVIDDGSACGEYSPTIDVHGANANLIAAAPELLEALQDMLSGWQYIRTQHGDLYGVGWDRAEQKAVSAINKALDKGTDK